MEQITKLAVKWKNLHFGVQENFHTEYCLSKSVSFPFLNISFFFFKLLGINLDIRRLLVKCSQHIPPGFSSFMWLLKCALLWHRRFLSALINALFQLQMLQQRQLQSLLLKLLKVPLFLWSLMSVLVRFGRLGSIWSSSKHYSCLSEKGEGNLMVETRMEKLSIRTKSQGILSTCSSVSSRSSQDLP